MYTLQEKKTCSPWLQELSRLEGRETHRGEDEENRHRKLGSSGALPQMEQEDCSTTAMHLFIHLSYDAPLLNLLLKGTGTPVHLQHSTPSGRSLVLYVLEAFFRHSAFSSTLVNICE